MYFFFSKYRYIESIFPDRTIQWINFSNVTSPGEFFYFPYFAHFRRKIYFVRVDVYFLDTLLDQYLTWHYDTALWSIIFSWSGISNRNGLFFRKEECTLRTMNAEKLLKTLPVLQAQLDSLLEFDCTANDLTNGVINMAFMLLFRDLIRLFACYNDGIINLLGLIPLLR